MTLSCDTAIDLTRDMVRNASDERAVANGCVFNATEALWPVWWIERFCRLYEGSQAGEPLYLWSSDDIARDFPPITGGNYWEDEDIQERMVARLIEHNELIASGKRTGWQFEATVRMFGWRRDSARWGDIRRFRQASIFVPKKSGKSPTLAAWGLYLLMGDDEPGQKIFFAAKDGSQARDIAGKHAAEMLMSSPELSAQCTYNKVLCQITHESSRSTMRPLSSGDQRHQQAKEGLNGSVLIDETHVVDREFVNRVSRAGISRRQPLQIEVSTAGNNPDGYGMERFDYGHSVIAGETVDQDLLAIEYAAPQDLSDDDLAADPVKYARMANPSIGHTIDEEELLTDYERSKASITKLADYKMYRLNIWQMAANPWLSKDAWAQARDEYTAEDLAGRECWAGLDLSSTQDMTSLVLAFRDDDIETVRLLAYFWLPEEACTRDKPYYQWGQHGDILLTPGEVCDYTFVRKTVVEASQQFQINQLLYDPYNAEQLTATLQDEDGIERLKFSQTMANFAEPTKEFERKLMEGTLRHNGHPVLSWQAGHVTVRSDVNANIRPVKPPRHDWRKIDGIVAAVMALAGVMGDEGGGESGVFFL